MNKQEIFLRKQESKIEKWVYKILSKLEKDFIKLLKTERKSYEVKSIEDDIRIFIENARQQIPEYLFVSLQWVMQKAYKQAYWAYKNWLPDYDSRLIFNIETEPAVKYLRNMETLHLSEKDWSIYKTTKKEILTLISDWVSLWKSYTKIAEEIEEVNPFVFSKERAKLIAIQETWQAYGWANYEPARKMKQKWYVMEKKWTTSHDDQVRDTHLANQEQGRIPLENLWVATGDMYAPSKDFRCRCTSITRVIW